jgi:poly(A) polymerase
MADPTPSQRDHSAENPVDRYQHGAPELLGVAMLAPGEREPDIDPALLDPDALRVIRGLRAEGFQAYLVGGCVRDLLVGRTPKDFDIATSAHPGEIRSTFRNCRLIGRRFRLAHVYFRGNKIIEVATFRKNPNPPGTLAPEAVEVPPEPPEEPLAPSSAEGEEGEEAEGPETEGPETEGAEATGSVAAPAGLAAAAVVEEPEEEETEETPDLLITEDNTFGTVEEDARRRDFTINGLFYDVTLGRVLDYVGGMRDLAKGLVRTIGDPEIRLREDPVRLLRAVRFACRLGFDIEPVTYAACEGAVEDLPRCAPPRLLEEIFKILRAGSAAPSFHLLEALGAIPMLLPALSDAIKKGPPELLVQIQQMLAQADARMGTGTVLDDALLFSALLEPVARHEKGEEGVLVDALMDNLIRTSRLPRRIADRVRHLLAAQKVLAGERRRRRSMASFRRTPYFADALVLFEMRVGATGEGTDLLQRWRDGKDIPDLPEPKKAAPAQNGMQNGAQNGEQAPSGNRPPRREKRRGPPPGALGTPEAAVVPSEHVATAAVDTTPRTEAAVAPPAPASAPQAEAAGEPAAAAPPAPTTDAPTTTH